MEGICLLDAAAVRVVTTATATSPLLPQSSRRCCRTCRDHCYCNITTAAAAAVRVVNTAAAVHLPLLPSTHCCYLPPTVTQSNKTGMLN